MARPAEESPEINTQIAEGLYRALRWTSPRACVEPPVPGEEAVIDGLFDYYRVAERFQEELRQSGLSIGSA